MQEACAVMPQGDVHIGQLLTVFLSAYQQFVARRAMWTDSKTMPGKYFVCWDAMSEYWQFGKLKFEHTENIRLMFGFFSLLLLNVLKEKDMLRTFVLSAMKCSVELFAYILTLILCETFMRVWCFCLDLESLLQQELLCLCSLFNWGLPLVDN